MVSKKNAAALRAGLCMGAFAVLAVAAGCGGGGGSEGDAAPAPAPAQTIENADYFPLQVGDRRSYRMVFALGPIGEQTYFFAESVTGTRDVDGASHFVVHQEDAEGGSDSLMTSGAAAVRERDASTAATLRDVLRFPATLGVPFDEDVGPFATEDVDGDGQLDTTTVHYTTTPLDLSTVETAAGRFERSLRVHSEVTATVRRSSDGTVETDTVSYDTWFAPGVGRVRVVETSADGQASVELLSWMPAGQAPKDTVAPALLGVAPAAGATTHPGARLVLTFDEPVSTFSVLGAVTLTDAHGEHVDVYASGPWDPTGRQLVLGAYGWEGGTYTVRIAAGITDLAGNAMTAPPDHTFMVDGSLPATTYTMPRAQADNVLGYSGVLTAYFSDAMDPATLDSVRLLEGSVSVPATVTLRYGYGLTVAPASPLKPSTRYTVDLNGLKGLNGNAIANPVDWTFVTGTTVTVEAAEDTARTAAATTLLSALRAPRRNAAVQLTHRTQ